MPIPSVMHIWMAQAKTMRQRRRWKAYVKIRNMRSGTTRGGSGNDTKYGSPNDSQPNKPKDIVIHFPKNCCFIDNFESFNTLINDVIDISHDPESKLTEWFSFDLKCVTHLDSAAVNVMLALVNYLNLWGYKVKGSVPENPEAMNFMVNSGFFEMVRSSHKIPHATDHVFTLTGNNQTNQDAIADEILKIMKHLTGESMSFQPLYNTLGEIVGNSVEHANEEMTYKNWFMSVHYEDSKVSIMMADIGKGILGTLNLLLKQKIYERIAWNKPQDTLLRLFKGQYQSSTREPNRNNGLPDMMDRFIKNYLTNVVVVTNNAVLDFKGDLSRELKNSFPGTFYLIEVTKENHSLWLNRIK